MTKKIPNGLKLASILIWVEAAIMAVGSIMAIAYGTTVSTFLGLSDLTSLFVAAGVITLIVAVAWFFLGFGVWKMNISAWWVAFVFVFLAVILGVVGMFGGLLGITVFGLGAIGFMSGVSLVIAVIQLVSLVDKDSMKACKARIGDWKGIEVF